MILSHLHRISIHVPLHLSISQRRLHLWPDWARLKEYSSTTKAWDGSRSRVSYIVQVPESLAEYGIRPRLISLWQEGHSKPGLQSLEQSCLLALMRSYKDILYTKHPYPQRSGLPTTPFLFASIVINGETIYAGQHQSCISWYKIHASKDYLLCGNKLSCNFNRAMHVLCNGMFWMRTDYQHSCTAIPHLWFAGILIMGLVKACLCCIPISQKQWWLAAWCPRSWQHAPISNLMQTHHYNNQYKICNITNCLKPYPTAGMRMMK